MADAQAQVTAPPTVVGVGVKRSAQWKGPSCSHQRNRMYLAGALQGRKQVLASLLRLLFGRFERPCVRPLPKEGCRPTEALPSALLVGAHLRLTGRTCQALMCEMVARRPLDCVVTFASWMRGRGRLFPTGALQGCHLPRPQLPMACRGRIRLGCGFLPSPRQVTYRYLDKLQMCALPTVGGALASASVVGARLHSASAFGARLRLLGRTCHTHRYIL